jgi:hypothetical protein
MTTVTADQVRALIIDHDASRPRSQQVQLGPSEIATPCARRIGYGLLGVPRAVNNDVSLYAWVGTQIHAGMEAACHTAGDRWITEHRVTIPINDTLTVTGSFDAYDRDTKTVIDWKGRGAVKPSQATRDKHHQQLAWYSLAAILQGLVVDQQAIVYIPRNGTLADIEVDARPFNPDTIETAMRRYEALHTATAAGPAVLPLLPAVHDCRFCGWWKPGESDLTVGCPGQPPTNPQGGDLPPWEPKEEAQEKAATTQ